jgi:hypothetical protein
VRQLGTLVKITGLAVCLCLIWLLSGTQDAAFRYMGF